MPFLSLSPLSFGLSRFGIPGFPSKYLSLRTSGLDKTIIGTITYLNSLFSLLQLSYLLYVLSRKPRELSYFSLAFPLYPLVKPACRHRGTAVHAVFVSPVVFFARPLCGITVHVVSLSLALSAYFYSPLFSSSRQIFPLRRRIFSHYLAVFLSTLRRDILQCLAAHVWRQFSAVGPLDLLK
jgi:hypothetical protein